MEVYVHIVVIVFVMTMAQFILHPAAAILYRMYQTVLAKQRQTAENTAFVDGQNRIFEVTHRHGMLLTGQCLHHHNAVACGFDTVPFKQFYTCRFIHNRCKNNNNFALFAVP